MSTDKPLHVRVAEVLGSMVRLQEGWWERLDGAIWTAAIPRYDTDWSATGPLIERYRLDVSPAKDGWLATSDLPYAATGGWGQAAGPSPQVAVCNLLLALKAAGKLEQA
jgi:hypothetical protein